MTDFAVAGTEGIMGLILTLVFIVAAFLIPFIVVIIPNGKDHGRVDR